MLEVQLRPFRWDGSSHLAFLPEEFDPNKHKIIMVDLENDPQVWIENYNDTLVIHKEAPTWKGAEGDGCFKVGENTGLQPTVYGSHVDPVKGIDNKHVGHMVCIGFLEPPKAEETEAEETPQPPVVTSRDADPKAWTQPRKYHNEYDLYLKYMEHEKYVITSYENWEKNWENQPDEIKQRVLKHQSEMLGLSYTPIPNSLPKIGDPWPFGDTMFSFSLDVSPKS